MKQNKPDLIGILTLIVLIVQVALLAAVVWRVNRIYQVVTATGATDLGLVANVSPDDDPFLGPQDASVTIVAFFDYACSSCRQSQETLAQVRDAYGDRVRIVLRDFPLGGPGSPSYVAALAADCAVEQERFFEMHDLLFQNQPLFDYGSLRSYAASLDLDVAQFDGCLSSEQYRNEVLGDYDDGVSYGVSATPTFFVNGRRLVGTVPLSAFQSAIDAALQ